MEMQNFNNNLINLESLHMATYEGAVSSFVHSQGFSFEDYEMINEQIKSIRNSPEREIINIDFKGNHRSIFVKCFYCGKIKKVELNSYKNSISFKFFCSLYCMGKWSFEDHHPMKRPEIVAKFLGNNHPLKNPIHKAKHLRIMQSEEYREKLKKIRNSPEIKEKTSGENHYNWKGGISQNIFEVKCCICKKIMKTTKYSLEHQENFCCSKKCIAAHRSFRLKNNNPFSRKENIEKTRNRMLNGGAAHALSFNQNPSKPQVELLKLIKQLYPQAILNYPSLNFSIDIAIPELKIAIEYDGSYWHQNKEYDNKRQKELENIGWKFIRYVDYIPSKEELKNNIIEDLK